MSRGKIKFRSPGELPKLRFLVMRFKTKKDSKPISKKFFNSDYEARSYFEDNKHKRNLILTKEL